MSSLTSLFIIPFPELEVKNWGCDGRRSSPTLESGLDFSGRGKKRRPGGKIGGRAENPPNHCSAGGLRPVRLRRPVCLTPPTSRPRTRWPTSRPKPWPPWRAPGTTWVPSAALSVSIHSFCRGGCERDLHTEQEKSCKLDVLRCNLIVSVVSGLFLLLVIGWSYVKPLW